MKLRGIINSPQLLLAGGGHAHVVALRLMGQKPIEGVKVTLVSDVTHATCTSMLPGVIAGKYKLVDAMIDLRRLCEFAGAEFIQGVVSGVDLLDRCLYLDRGTRLPFRLLSLNLGSRPAFSDDESVRKNAWAFKPIELFLSRLEDFIAAHQEGDPKTFVIVGGGKSGFELACALRERLHSDVILHIVQPANRFLEDYKLKTSCLAKKILADKKIVVHLDEYVTEVTSSSVLCESGLEVPADVILWTSHPEPAVKWLHESGLSVDSQGFLYIRGTLQSASHTYVFGVGELTRMQDCNCPSTSALSIKHGELLYSNLNKWIQGAPLESFERKSGMTNFIFAGTNQVILQSKLLIFNSRLASHYQSYKEKRFVRRHSF